MSGVLPVADSRDQPETPRALPLGPRSAVPAGRRSLGRREKKDNKPARQSDTPVPPVTPALPELPEAWSATKEEATQPTEPKSWIRPYTRTGGRTRADYRLELETLLSTPVGREHDIQTLRADHRTICEMCRMPHSTAEVAARLGLPLGAARVLIGDVVSLALLSVHETAAAEGPSMDLLQRVAAGLKRL